MKSSIHQAHRSDVAETPTRFVILHQTPFWARPIQLGVRLVSWAFKRQTLHFWQTEINDQGVLVSNYLFAPTLIPWADIECLDLNGLEPTSWNWLKAKHPVLAFLISREQTRFFLLMSANVEILKAASLRSGRKIWLPGTNVLAVTRIRAGYAAKALRIIRNYAAARKIKLNAIVLDDY